MLDSLSPSAAGTGVIVGAALLLPVLTYLYWRVSRGPGASLLLQGTKCPPVEGGWLPWVGCALAFGKEPLWFIKKVQEKHGDVFTINVAGKWMTFIMNPSLYHHFFTSNSVDFQAAVLPICQRVAGMSPSSFSTHHTPLHDSVKGRLSSTTSHLCHTLSAEFHASLCDYGNTGQMELMDFVRDAMFESVVRQLFGKENVPATKEEMRQMMTQFIKYDQDFEYGADLPEIFVKDWRDCKYALLARFQTMADKLSAQQKEKAGLKAGPGEEDHVVLDILTEVLGSENGLHNYALLMLWASQSNAVPAVFWTLCHLLTDAECFKRAREEVKSLSSCGVGSEFKPVEEEELKKLPYIKRCVLEAIRLHAPGMIVRKVIKTHSINGYTVPAGHMLMLSPYWSHRNSTLFPQPELFKPDRWLDCDLERRQFLDGFVGFGGGRYQCPGKWFALMEMHLFVAMVINMFDLQLQDPMPPPSPLHLIGTQQPATNCAVIFTRTTQ